MCLLSQYTRDKDTIKCGYSKKKIAYLLKLCKFLCKPLGDERRRLPELFFMKFYLRKFYDRNISVQR